MQYLNISLLKRETGTLMNLYITETEIRRLRKNKGKSMKEIAAACNMSYTRLSELELNLASAHKSEISALAKIYNVQTTAIANGSRLKSAQTSPGETYYKSPHKPKLKQASLSAPLPAEDIPLTPSTQYLQDIKDSLIHIFGTEKYLGTTEDVQKIAVDIGIGFKQFIKQESASSIMDSIAASYYVICSPFFTISRFVWINSVLDSYRHT